MATNTLHEHWRALGEAVATMRPSVYRESLDFQRAVRATADSDERVAIGRENGALTATYRGEFHERTVTRKDMPLTFLSGKHTWDEQRREQAAIERGDVNPAPNPKWTISDAEKERQKQVAAWGPATVAHYATDLTPYSDAWLDQKLGPKVQTETKVAVVYEATPHLGYLEPQQRANISARRGLDAMDTRAAQPAEQALTHTNRQERSRGRSL